MHKVCAMAVRAAALSFLASVLALSGCSTTDATYINLDASHPSLEIDGSRVKFNGEYIDPYKVPKILEQFEVPKDRVINIRISKIEDFSGRDAMALKRLLAMHGYKRTALVTAEHAESWSIGPQVPILIGDPETEPLPASRRGRPVSRGR